HEVDRAREEALAGALGPAHQDVFRRRCVPLELLELLPEHRSPRRPGAELHRLEPQRIGAVLLLEAPEGAAGLDEVAVLEEVALFALAVDEHAVGAAEVVDDEALALAEQLRVA